MQLAYVFCHVCGRQMLPSADLRGYLDAKPERESAVVVSAQYGHITDPERRIDVSAPLMEKVRGGPTLGAHPPPCRGCTAFPARPYTCDESDRAALAPSVCRPRPSAVAPLRWQ